MTAAIHDYAAIADELRKLAGEDEPPTGCVTCDGTGWQIRLYMFGPYFQVCADCGNPGNLPQP